MGYIVFFIDNLSFYIPGSRLNLDMIPVAYHGEMYAQLYFPCFFGTLLTGVIADALRYDKDRRDYPGCA